MKSSSEIVYAQKLLNRDLRRLACDSFKEKNDKYLGCEDGWIFKPRGGKGRNGEDDDDDGDEDDDRHRRKHNDDDDDDDLDERIKVGSKTETKFRLVWIQGFVAEYVEAKDWLLVDDGTGCPWTVVHAAKNPTSVKWLKNDDDDNESAFESRKKKKKKKMYVQVLGEPVVPKEAKSKEIIHVAAVKVQNLTPYLPSFSLADVDASCREEVEAASASCNSLADTDADKLQLYQWTLEVQHAQLRSLFVGT